MLVVHFFVCVADDFSVSSLLVLDQKVSLPQDWADYLNMKLEKDKVEPPNLFLLLLKRTKKE